MSAEENVKNIVGVPLYAIMVFRSCCPLCQYAELPVMFPTYLDSFVINDLEVLLPYFAILLMSGVPHQDFASRKHSIAVKFVSFGLSLKLNNKI